MAGRNEPVERRASPRTEVLGRVSLTVLSTPVPARLREISTGGCAVETPTPLPQGVHHFRLDIEGQAPVELAAELVHSTRLTLSGGETIHLAGFEFLPLSEPTSRALTGLVEHIGTLCLA